MHSRKMIEIHNGEHPRVRISLDSKTTTVNVPVVSKDGYGEISFSASGMQAEDGVEIWTPQNLSKQ